MHGTLRTSQLDDSYRLLTSRDARTVLGHSSEAATFIRSTARTGIRLVPALALVAPCLGLGLAAQGRRAQIVSPALRGGDASKRSCRSQLCDRAAEPAGRWSIRRLYTSSSSTS